MGSKKGRVFDLRLFKNILLTSAFFRKAYIFLSHQLRNFVECAKTVCYFGSVTLAVQFCPFTLPHFLTLILKEGGHFCK